MRLHWEDGFEIGMPNEHATTVADALFDQAETYWPALGAATAFDWKQGFVVW